MSRNKNLFFVLAIVLAVPLLYPLFKTGFPITDDADWLIIRFTAFHQVFTQGHFPVRWLGRLNFNFGYPVANFNYPAYMYVAELPKLLGFGFVSSIKLTLGVCVVSSGIFSYLWLNKMFTRFASLVGAVVYIYNPYFLFDIYRRGSIGEIIAFAIVPFILWSIERKSKLWTTLGLAMLITAHNILALLFFPVIIAYLYIQNKFSKRNLLLCGVLGLGLSAFFWLPAIYDLQYTFFTQTKISQWQDHFADLDLFGYVNIVILLSSLWIILKKRTKLPTLVWGVVALAFWLSTSLSSLAWSVLPVKFVQFPFRMLSITLPGLSLLTVYVLDSLQKKLKIGVGVVLVISLLGMSIPVLLNVDVLDKGEGFYSTNESSSTIKNEYMPIWVEEQPTARAEQKVQLIEGKGEIVLVREKGHRVEFIAELDSFSTIAVNSIYFPGWIAKIDGEKADIKISDNGIMNVQIPAGRHLVLVVFQETAFRMIANMISVLSLFIVLILQFRLWKK